MSSTQDHIYLSVSTPLGKDKLLLRSFHGEEQLCGLFHFTLEMVSEDKNLSFDSIVGKNATITMALSNGHKRYLNGIVGRVYQGGTDAAFTTYYAELRPWFWLLTMTADSRIFQQQSVPQIIKAVFADLRFSDYRDALTKTYEQREYCVQYQETAFNFVSRLMEDEGIFYFFEHQDGRHTMVLADDADAHKPCPSVSHPVRYTSSLAGDTTEDAITRCVFEQQVTTGKYAVEDFNFETPANNLIAEMAGSNGKLRIYEYPGGFDKQDASEKKAKVRLESHEWSTTLLRGEGFSPAFTAGCTFHLVGHDRDDANTSYILQRVSHSATVVSYTNRFEAFPANRPYRPPRLATKPVIPGSQTAVVVGKSGEEIWTDKYGRVKVQFHWDQKSKKDEHSSCWIRVMQGWAGKNWGSIFIPRIGQEVVVSFLNGDPDRPLVTGCVYNAQQIVPYTLPENQTKSTIKSNSSKGGGGFNEIRFEDKKDAEEMYIHAQKDMNIEVEHDRTTTIQKGNESLTVKKGDRKIMVNTGNETHEVKGTRSITVTGNETHTNKANFYQDVSGNYTLKVKGDLTIDVTGSVTIKAGMNLTTQARQNLTNKAGMAMNNEAGMTLTSKGSVSQTVESSGVVTVKGTLVKIN